MLRTYIKWTLENWNWTYIKWKLNWLPTNQRLKQCVTTALFKFVQNKHPGYMNEVFKLAEQTRINTRNSCLTLSYPFWKTNTSQNDMSYIGPVIWSKITKILKKTKNLNTFKHRMKRYYLNVFSNSNLWKTGGFDFASKRYFSFH